jgi:hypothetical protein
MTGNVQKTPPETPNDKRYLENHNPYERIILKRILNMVKCEFTATADTLDS